MKDINTDSVDFNLNETIDSLFSSEIDPIRHLRELDYPRRAGTSGDQQVVDYLVSTLKDLDYEPQIQKFHYWKSSKLSSLRFPLIILTWGLVTFLNLLYFDNNKVLGLITLVLPMTIIFALLRFEHLMKFFFKRNRRKMEELEAKIEQKKLTNQEESKVITSQNVLAEIGNKNASQHILFTAHFDSISSKLPMKFTKIAGIIGFISLILFSLLYSLNFIGEIYFDWDLFHIFGPINIILLIAMLIPLEFILVARTFRGNSSHGIIDDGTGVAILLEIAKFLKGQNIGHYKFTFGFFGAEEAGLIGSSYYHRHSTQEKNTHVISVDMIGEKPPLAYVKGINPLIKTKLGSEFNTQIVSIAEQLEIEVKGSNFMYPGSDFAHWLYAGYKTNWIINGSRFIHSKNDNMENLDESLVKDALRLLMAYLVLEYQIRPDPIV
ncbi:MAG: M28 family metallopeptidase [Candidatus Hodarchaeales archaeon]